MTIFCRVGHDIQELSGAITHDYTFILALIKLSFIIFLDSLNQSKLTNDSFLPDQS